MFSLLFFIISYGAFLLIVMPSIILDIIYTAVILAIGVVWIILKKETITSFRKGNRRLFIPAFIIAAYLGWAFYKRWFYYPQIQAIADRLHMRLETLLVIGSVLLSVLSVYFLFVGIQFILERLTSPSYFSKCILPCLIAASVTVISTQMMLGIDGFSMGYFNFLWCTLIVTAAILALLCLFGRIIPAIVIAPAIFMLFSTVNVYIYEFRERLLEPVDFLSIGTAMNVVDNYSLFPVPLSIVRGWGFFLVMLIVLICHQFGTKIRFGARRRLLLLAVCIISSFAIFFYTANLKTYHWEKEGARFNGYILDFASKFKEISVPEPDNYSIELIDELAEQYSVVSSESENRKPKLPHIIVVMDESFSDLSVLGNFTTNKEVTPFTSSLKDNTVSGYTLVSVFGGNTPNSEYEFLTGNSLAGMSPNAVPYQQYMHSQTYSMVSYLKSLYNYRCVAMHPFLSNGWNRPAAYASLGFDDCYFLNDFPQKNLIREYVSDQEMFEFLIKTFETQKDDPLFIFGVTMQNHGGYNYEGDNYTQEITVDDLDEKYPDAEQYLSLIHESDKAVEYLITYFQSVDEDVVILFYGDHQPKLDEAFYEAIGETTVDTLDEQQKRYKVPFFIWANYDIEERNDIDCNSLNYLSSYVYDVAGIELPPYNKFLQDMENVVPAMNANGFYSPAAEGFLPFDEANEEEKKWLGLYEVLRYNNTFDNKNRNEKLFPVLEK